LNDSEQTRASELANTSTIEEVCAIFPYARGIRHQINRRFAQPLGHPCSTRPDYLERTIAAGGAR
jgi:hypothetical protein